MRTRFIVPVLAFVLFAVSLAIGFALFNDTNPLGGLRIGVGPDAIRERAQQEADRLGLDRTGLVPRIQMELKEEILAAAYARNGLAKGNEILRTRAAGYQWVVEWMETRESSSSGDREEPSSRGLESTMRMAFDLDGRMLGFHARIPDSIPLPSLSADSARLVADAFLAHSLPRFGALTGIVLKEEKRVEIPRSGRTDYEYSWAGTDSLLGNSVTVTMRIAGSRVVALERTDSATALSTEKGIWRYAEVGAVIFLVLIAATMVVVGVRRIRVYEIGWRTGIFVGILGAVLFGLDLYFSMSPGLDIRAVVSLSIAPLFMGGFMLLSWAVAESVGREVWKEKFVSVDLITRGYLLDSRVATAVLVGCAAGAFSNVVWSAGIWLLEHVAALSFLPEATQIQRFASRPAPGLSLLAHQASSHIFILSALMLFPLSIARRRFSSPWLLAAIGSLLVVFPEKPALDPFVPGMFLAWLSMAVIAGVLVRADLVAAFVALVTAPALFSLPVFLRSGDPAVSLSGQMVLVVFGIVIAVAWIGILTKDRVTDVESITPAFARLISERERLQQELRIARDVQMSLLPKSTPSIPGLDIAARCVPAQEVGGDYYDFVSLDEGRLGLVIGDVSGKGTEGAFYMTLTKGFLKAVVRESASPAIVLTQANELFCENVERGNFISMIYATFDARTSVVTFARAGHNPVILYRARSGSASFFQPRGIALGLEPGEVFATTIEEVSVPLEPGDALVLYTDGFGEAMNRKGEQFGEDRLQASIIRLSNRPSGEMLDGILSDVRSFVGRADQHDDMTMVIVRKT